MNETQSKVEQAREAILARKLFQPEVAIVLGSGLGGLANEVTHPCFIPYSEIPHFPSTSAQGHAGQLVLGYLCGVPVVLMQGRVHAYEGWNRDAITFGIRCMNALGTELLVTTNAAGGLNPRFMTGDLMVIDSHIDYLWLRSGVRGQATPGQYAQTDSPAESEVGNVNRSGALYDVAVMQRVKSFARRRDIVLHQGCYLATLGPTYETRAEYKMFRGMGADAVGMSTVPEVLIANSLGMETAAFSVITNVASTDFPQATSHEEVVDSGNLAGPKLMSLIRDLMEERAGCPD